MILCEAVKGVIQTGTGWLQPMGCVKENRGIQPKRSCEHGGNSRMEARYFLHQNRSITNTTSGYDYRKGALQHKNNSDKTNPESWIIRHHSPSLAMVFVRHGHQPLNPLRPCASCFFLASSSFLKFSLRLRSLGVCTIQLPRRFCLSIEATKKCFSKRWSLHLGVSIVMGVPQNGWFIMENPI